MRRTIVALAVFIAGLLSSPEALSQDSAKTRVVLRGFDPVAYFTDGKPVKGDERITYDYDEGRYYFASTAHRDMFASDPERYAPQFGGYCTGSLSRGVRGNEANPAAWVIVDGKLYVFGAGDEATALALRKNYQELAEMDPILFSHKAAWAAKNYKDGR